MAKSKRMQFTATGNQALSGTPRGHAYICNGETSLKAKIIFCRDFETDNWS